MNGRRVIIVNKWRVLVKDVSNEKLDYIVNGGTRDLPKAAQYL